MAFLMPYLPQVTFIPVIEKIFEKIPVKRLKSNRAGRGTIIAPPQSIQLCLVSVIRIVAGLKIVQVDRRAVILDMTGGGLGGLTGMRGFRIGGRTACHGLSLQETAAQEKEQSHRLGPPTAGIDRVDNDRMIFHMHLFCF